MARFTHTFRVRTPLGAVWQMHEHPSALKELTPPPIQVEILHMDEPLGQGSVLKFRLGVGPIGSIWEAVYDEFTPFQQGMQECGFVDRAISSPFHSWIHRHIFRDLGDNTSTITDDARFELLGGSLGSIITWLVGYPAIAVLFLYRRAKTYRMLARFTK